MLFRSDFSRIYDSTYCSGDFGSCMMDGGLHSFYKDYVDTSAAYLQDDEGNILARAIIYNKVIDSDTGEVYRYMFNHFQGACPRNFMQI